MAKYMVLYLGIEDGKVQSVYEANELGKIDSKVEPIENEGLSKALPHLADIEQIESLTTFYAQSSPRCIYIRFGGRWIKICVG